MNWSRFREENPGCVGCNCYRLHYPEECSKCQIDAIWKCLEVLSKKMYSAEERVEKKDDQD